MSSNHRWTDEYKEKCFEVWYLNGRPKQSVRLKEMIQDITGPDEYGRIPSHHQINVWLGDGVWDMRADELDAKAIQIADDGLINQKAEILKRHQAQALKIQMKALEYLEQEGFDTAASAVNAYFKSTEEERKTQGFSDLLEKLESMSNNQVRDEIIALINRATENDQITDADVKDIAGQLDTVSSNE